VHCSSSDAYLIQIKNDAGLEALLAEAIEDISAAFNSKIDYGIPTNQLFNVRYAINNLDPRRLFISNPHTRGGRFLESKRIFLLQDYEWLANKNLVGPYVWRGSYRYDSGAIFLHENGDSKNSWCRTAVLHETIHSVSLYSRIWNVFPDIIQRHLFLNEGVCECLTGYVLFKQHYECYDEWKKEQIERCSMAYKESTKIWSSLSQIIGIRPITEFYFSSGNIFTLPWNQLTQEIAKVANTFKFVVDESKIFRETNFREECLRSIPSFREIYESPNCFDFSNSK
jgi:hypothetical protein